MYEQIQALVQEHGVLFYVITFVWAFFEGETFLIFAGFLASQEFLHLWTLIIVAGFGTTCGDFCFFLLGRRYGPKLLKRMPRLAKGQAKATQWLEKHDVVFILTYRFIYGLRNISAITIGTSSIPWQRYFFLNFLGSYIWAISFGCIGYLFGDLVVREGENPINAVMIGILILFVTILGIRYIMHRRAQNEAKREVALAHQAEYRDQQP